MWPERGEAVAHLGPHAFEAGQARLYVLQDLVDQIVLDPLGHGGFGGAFFDTLATIRVNAGKEN
jgi:hypothetical protein